LECAAQTFPYVGNISLTFSANKTTGYHVNMDGQQDLGAELTQSESLTKQQLYEKVRKRMAELASQTDNAASFCPELNPDVIVISDDQSLLFEPQNQRALEVLAVRCGLAMGFFKLTERIRVHPLRSRKIIDDLTRAGLHVAQECSS
jgi:hypothetical protein